MEARTGELGQWLSCEEAADLLGVTKQTLANWRRLRDAARQQKKDLSPWPAHFRSPKREETAEEYIRRERLSYEEGGSQDPDSRQEWRHDQPEEFVPSSHRDPSTGQTIGHASGRHPPVVYDRNLLLSWVRKAVYGGEHE